MSGQLFDFDYIKPVVQRIKKFDIEKLIRPEIDNYRFITVKHMPPNTVNQSTDYIARKSVSKSVCSNHVENNKPGNSPRIPTIQKN